LNLWGESMGISPDLLNAPKEFLSLFKAGKEAAQRGEKAKAHHFFRQAIEIDPYHEQVWLWLASVVESDEDRQVCFENVLELNPTNLTARHQLQKLEQKALIETMNPHLLRRRNRQRWLWVVVVVGTVVAVGLVAVLLVTVI
jgi:hypothetical protein